MSILNLDTILLSTILFAVNFIAVIAINADERFWLPTIILWITLFFFFIVVRTISKDQVRNEELLMEQKNTGTDNEKNNSTWTLDKAKQQSKQLNTKLFDLLGAQTICCFLFHLIGFAKTRKDYYKKSFLAFFFLSFVFAAIKLFE